MKKELLWTNYSKFRPKFNLPVESHILVGFEFKQVYDIAQRASQLNILCKFYERQELPQKNILRNSES